MIVAQAARLTLPNLVADNADFDHRLHKLGKTLAKWLKDGNGSIDEKLKLMDDLIAQTSKRWENKIKKST